MILISLAAFIFLLFAGFFGSPIGNRNIIITIVWILWWFILVTIMVPFGARIWCMMCPFPFFGEWFQRGKLLGPRKREGEGKVQRMKGLSKRWPRPLANIWLQNFLFLTLCTFSTILVTRPVVTAYALTGLAIAAFVVHFIYRRRTFCRYLCPIGGWMSLYSKASMLEVRSRNPAHCRQCRAKSCAVGNSHGWGCPWDLVPGRLKSNNSCGVCMECIKTCPNDNMTIRARPFCVDMGIQKYDEAWMLFIMMSLAMIYTAIFLGPWGTLKEWANISEMGNWPGFMIYVASMWLGCLVVMPALWYLASRGSKFLSGSARVEVKNIFLNYSYMLVPLGLLAWIAFSLPLVMINYTHITTSLSDPMGWGWDLFGTADDHWQPLLPEYVHYLQVPLVLTGLGLSLNRGFVVACRIFEEKCQAVRSLIPFGILNTLIALILVVLFAG